MITEPINTKRIFSTSAVEPTRRRFRGSEIEVLRHLGIHCNAGGQCTLPTQMREGAGILVRLGLVEMWFRQERGVGLTQPFYALTLRGQQAAAALLRSRRKPSRTGSGGKQGEGDVSAR